MATMHEDGEPADASPRLVEFTSVPERGESAFALGARLGARLHGDGLWIVRHEVHGPLREEPEFRRGLERAWGRIDWPVHWVEGQGWSSRTISGMHVWALAGPPGETLTLAGRPVARLFRDLRGRNLVIGGLSSVDPGAARAFQAESVFSTLEALLREARMTPAHVLRTWFAAADILGWYASFNLVRTAAFSRLGLHPFPASTAIGGLHPRGGHLLASAWALEPAEGCAVSTVASPLQGPASRYGSMFARATRITASGSVQLLVSGTASIDADGFTLHPGRPRPQIDHTLDVLGALLRGEGFSFADVTRATVYPRSREAARGFLAARRERGLPTFPLAACPAVVCREDLCFEMEIDARRRPISPTPH